MVYAMLDCVCGVIKHRKKTSLLMQKLSEIAFMVAQQFNVNTLCTSEILPKKMQIQND